MIITLLLQQADKERRSGELLALLRMGGAIVTGAQGKRAWNFLYGEQRRCPPCPRLPEKRLQSYAVGYGAAGTEAAQEKCVYFDRPAVSGQLAVPWGNGILIRSWISVMRAGWYLPKNGGLIWRALSLAAVR